MGVLALNNDDIINNRAGDGGAGSAAGSTSSDTLGGTGGPGGDGGGIDSTGALSMTQDLLKGNTAGAGGQGGRSPTQYGSGATGGEGGNGGAGGGVYASGTLTLNHVTFMGNIGGIGGTGGDGGFAGGNGGSGGAGGGIYSTAPTVIANSTLRNDSAGGGGLAGSGVFIGNGGLGGTGGAGGAIYATSMLSLTGDTISANSAGNGGYGGGGGPVPRGGSGGNGGVGGDAGGLWVSGTATVIGNAIVNNTAGSGGAGGQGSPPLVGVGGGAGNGGVGGNGGAMVVSGTVSLLNDTIGNNIAGTGGLGGPPSAYTQPAGIGGAGGNAGAILSTGVMTLVNDTLSGNVAGAGGHSLAASPAPIGNAGAFLIETNPFGGDVTLYNSIVAGNFNSSGAADDIRGTLDAHLATGQKPSSYNLIGPGGSGGLVNGANGNQVGVANPMLGPLADNGGPTQTMALLPGSPSIDAGSNALAVDSNGTPLATDQRGFARISNGIVDIGAYELQQTLELLSTVIGDGSLQRSEVRGFTLSFNQPVMLAAGGVTLALLNTGGSGKNDGSAPTDVSAALNKPTTADGGFTWVFSFNSGDTSAVDRTGSLADGIYTVTIHSSGVTGSSGNLSGDQQTTFHRLFGDINGDKTVNNLDYFQFSRAFSSRTGNAAYNADFDFNGDGVINNTDYFQFNKNFAKTFSY